MQNEFFLLFQHFKGHLRAIYMHQLMPLVPSGVPFCISTTDFNQLSYRRLKLIKRLEMMNQ